MIQAIRDGETTTLEHCFCSLDTVVLRRFLVCCKHDVRYHDPVYGPNPTYRLLPGDDLKIAAVDRILLHVA